MVVHSIGMFMLGLLDEWNKLERTGSVAIIYNTINKKHSIFHKQILEMREKKRKKYSHKCVLFNLATTISIEAWGNSIIETKKFKISANTTIHNLYRLNRDSFTRIYGLKEDVFRKINKIGIKGLTLSSCKVSRIMINALENAINAHFLVNKERKS